MGVRYLNRFLHNYPVQLLEKFDVGEVTLVIDGSELLYQLYFYWGNFDTRCGGEYSELHRITIDFFETLRQCKIKYYVIFDSFKSQNNPTRFLKRRKEKLASVRQLVENGQSDCKVHPNMGKDVLKQTLIQEEVPFLVASGDGDATISAIANDLDAFVLANDTDFCIYDLKKGLIIMDNFEWQNVLREEKHYCQGNLYRREVLYNTFGTPLQSIPFLEPLLSNQDGISGVDFIPFLKGLSREVSIPADLPPNTSRRPDFILNILLWLKKNYTDDEKTINLIQQRVPELPVGKFRECLHIYNMLPDVRSEIAQLENTYRHQDTGASCFSRVEGLSMPADFLAIVPEDQSQASVHKASEKIREAIYRIGFSREPQNPNTILVADRDGFEYRSKILPVEVDDESIEPLQLTLPERDLTLQEDFADIMLERKLFFQHSVTLDATPEDLGDVNELLARSMIFWSSLEDDKPSSIVRRALAVTITCLYHDLDHNDLFQVEDTNFDKAVLHSSMRWQVCITEMMRLNNVLGQPFVNPTVGKVFSGKLVQKAYHFLVDYGEISVNDLAVRLFGENELAQSFFIRISRFMEC